MVVIAAGVEVYFEFSGRVIFVDRKLVHLGHIVGTHRSRISFMVLECGDVVPAGVHVLGVLIEAAIIKVLIAAFIFHTLYGRKIGAGNQGVLTRGPYIRSVSLSHRKNKKDPPLRRVVIYRD